MQNAVDAASLAASEEITAAVYTAGQGTGLGEYRRELDRRQLGPRDGRRRRPAQRRLRRSDERRPVRQACLQSDQRPMDDPVGRHSVQRCAGHRPADQRRYHGARRTVSASLRLGGRQIEHADHDDVDGLRRGPRPRSRARLQRLDGRRQLARFVDLSATEVNNALDAIWTALRTADPKWPGTTTSKFPATGFGSINSAVGTSVSSTNTTTIMTTLGLTTNVSGHRKYPFPQSGRNANNDPNPQGKRLDQRYALARIHQLREGPQRHVQQEVRLSHAHGLPRKNNATIPASRKTSGGRPSIRIRPSRTAPRCS